MKFEDVERQAFEEFGEINVFETANEDIDLAANDIANDISIEIPEHVANDVSPILEDLVPSADEQAKIEEPQLIDTARHEPVKTAFSWAGFAGGLASLIWIAGAIGGPISYYGLDAILTLDPAMQAGLIALAFGPAVLFWLTAAAAGEALKARRLAVELTRLARDARTPAQEADTHAQKLSLTVKTEIESLNDAVATAMNRLAELEAAAQRNVALFDGAITATRENTSFLAGHLARERDALMELNSEVKGQTETMSQSIGRQIRLMREASKLVKSEIIAAEDALEGHLASFAAQAVTMAERTTSFHQVASTATSATASLNTTMTDMLDGLSEATRLTDSARQSSQEAVKAANDTASAVRESTRTAVFEAKKAAQMIRAETTALQEAAADTLAKLHEAADAARAASEESQAAADRHSASIEKRLSALAATANVKKAAPVPAPAAPLPTAERKPAPVAVQTTPATLQAAAEQAIAQARVENIDARRDRAFNGFKWVKKDVEAPKPQTADAFELVDFGSRKNADIALKHQAIDLVVNAGVDLDAVLRPADLERIALQSRNGAVARRRAVIDAAPGAVNRIVRHVKRNGDARQVAADFRGRPDLAKSENKGEGKDLVRTYLLIDAALA
jgi:chemotaxis protein histidine kinase CheA